MSILVLGIGNLLMADDGVGVRIAQGLSSRYRFPSRNSLRIPMSSVLPRKRGER